MQQTKPSSHQWTSMKREQQKSATAQFHLTRLLWLSGISLLLVPIATIFDLSVARWFAGEPLSKDLNTTLEHTELFSHGFGVFLILVGIIQLAPERRWHIPRLATLALGAGAVATLAKLFIIRPRPNSRFVNLDSPIQDSAWAWSFDWSLSHVGNFDASFRAFPSANVATATAFTVGLLVVLPRGRWLFACLCLGTIMQRLNSGGHFLSDLFGSVAVGLSWAYVCHHPALLGSIFDNMKPEPKDRRRGNELNDADQIELAPNQAIDGTPTDSTDPNHSGTESKPNRDADKKAA